MKLNDQSRMPFGIHKDKRMERVPASYLLWLWEGETNENPFWSADRASMREDRAAVYDYIVENFSSLETEAKDFVVSHFPKGYRGR
jgi:hypothetical protein